MTDYTDLLARVAAKARAESGNEYGEYPGGLPEPLSAARIDEVEQLLGFRLHPLLAALYREIANGGFGPEYKLFSLIDGPTSEQVLTCYTAERAGGAGTDWAWPEGVLPILTWGCGMYACVDCRSPEGTVLLFEPNPGEPDLAWWIDSPSLAAWLDHYVADTGWWSNVEAGGDIEELLPWREARPRAAV